MASLFPEGFRWDDSDDEDEAIPHVVIIRYNNDGKSLTVTNQSNKNQRVLISLDNKLIKFNVNKSSNRNCWFVCNPSKVHVDGKPIVDGNIFLGPRSKALLDGESDEQPLIESPRTSDGATSAGTNRSSHDALKMQLAKLIMMAESRRYEFRYYMSDEASQLVANNLFD